MKKLEGLSVTNLENGGTASRSKHMKHNDDEKIKKWMQQQYLSEVDLDVKRPPPPISGAVKRATELLQKTLQKKDEGYEVGLLWKQEEVQFPNSYPNALKRLEVLERQLSNDPALNTRVQFIFSNYIAKGYLRKLTPTEAAAVTPRTFYIPYYIANDSDNRTVAPRLIFNTNAQVKRVSLNSHLLAEPHGANPPYADLLHFREGSIGVTGSIQEMYHRVRIRPADQDAQRILWRACEPRTPDVYVMQVLIASASCAAACAQAVKHANAQAHAHTHPLAAESMDRQHYVHHYLESFFSLDEATETVRQVIEIHDAGGFRLQQFATNRPDLLRGIAVERAQHTPVALKIPEHICEYGEEKMLTAHWVPTTDELGYRVNLASAPRTAPTVREVLHSLMSVHDPLGLISYVTLAGAMLMRDIQALGSDWGSGMPAALLRRWASWLSLAEATRSVKIPRALTGSINDKVDLHTFVHASEGTFVACVYARISCCRTRSPAVKLLTGTARIAPLPRSSAERTSQFQLQAAVLAVRLAERVRQDLRLFVAHITYWTASEVALSWIKFGKDHKYIKPVTDRVNEILQYSEHNCWNWVPEGENPANITRSPTARGWCWITGPPFLSHPLQDWPQRAIGVTGEGRWQPVEVRPPTMLALPVQEYSCWARLLRHLAIMKKFVDFIRDRASVSRRIEPVDVQAARSALYRTAQWEGFPDEMQTLAAGQPLSKRSPLNKLKPFLDTDGVMRCRKHLAEPILLPQKPKLVKLLMKNVHARYGHRPDQAIIRRTSGQFWIINVGAVMRNVRSCCAACILASSAPERGDRTPPVAHRHAPPFFNTVVDYFGPVPVAAESRKARWILMFWCTATRAMHLELAERLEMDCFFQCFRRFQEARGQICNMYSDNGDQCGNDEGRALRALLQAIGQRMEREQGAELRWHSRSQSASRFGGPDADQEMQNVRRGLMHMLSVWKYPALNSLRVALVLIESILNHRPLTHLPVDGEGDKIRVPLPDHLQRGTSRHVRTLSVSLRKRTRHHVNLFWQRWSHEHLQWLRRQRRKKTVAPITVGDLVVMARETPGKWCKGRIVNVHLGRDGQAGFVKARVGESVKRRSVIKVAILTVKQQGHPLMPPPPSRKRARSFSPSNVPDRELPCKMDKVPPSLAPAPNTSNYAAE